MSDRCPSCKGTGVKSSRDFRGKWRKTRCKACDGTGKRAGGAAG